MAVVVIANSIQVDYLRRITNNKSQALMQIVLHYSVSALAVSQLLFMGLSSLVHYRHQTLARLMALYSVGLIFYIILVMPVTEFAPTAAQQTFRAFASSTPFLLWLISRNLFMDQHGTPAWAWATLAVYVSLRVIGSILISTTGEIPFLSQLLLMQLPLAVMLGFTVHAIYLALKHFNSDLVESRRRLRGPFVVSMGLIVGVIVASGFFYSVPGAVRIGFFTVIFACALFFNIVIFRLHHDSSQLIRNKAVGVAHNINLTDFESRSDKALLERLKSAMEKDQLYTKLGLTIKDLAMALGIQEYLLRRFINKKMHYRNFNQFLNEYRINKATARLMDPSEFDTQISNIAFEVGYASLSSFNKAFKEKHGVTPSAFRNQLGSQEFDQESWLTQQM
ncbi:helix-turn-helix transcriptional regulator [Pseudohongiella sp. SYSU M77423]|uniref:helix-turn-helix domain-containing protein n=1 Tax=Pseudohongiella sp. SYSU M77423 TaxID=3042312 RepID=UPI0024806041|nr:helix-turn-helix transcriptional regulator [Pseudohongiella sp. SYSU M77423]MDH7943400.1 helix-turn-helix transcriptional regulator [Pseudohongiella sp. SYSU M77423]